MTWIRFGGEGLQRSVAAAAVVVDCWSWLVLRFELSEVATAAEVVLVAFVVVADVVGVVAAVAIDGAALAADAEAADDEATILDVDVEAPDRVASTGLSHELLLLQGCE